MEHGWCDLYASLKPSFKSRDPELTLSSQSVHQSVCTNENINYTTPKEWQFTPALTVLPWTENNPGENK